VDSLWVGGHLASQNPSPEPLMALARLGALTRRVTIGTATLLLPLYPPAMVAKQIADLDRASGGRVALGVGVGGEYPSDFEAASVPIGERGTRADEAIELLRRFWTAAPVDHEGRHFHYRDLRIHPAPVQAGGPRILVSGRREAAMRRAAWLGDGWMPYLYSPRRYRESVERIGELAVSRGRVLDGFEWLAYLFVAADDDDRAARRGAAEFLGSMYRQEFDAMIDHVAVVGTFNAVGERLDEYVDAGARHLIICPMLGDRLAVVERLIKERTREP
jgi:probable F420-dependent oxidoreductase